MSAGHAMAEWRLLESVHTIGIGEMKVVSWEDSWIVTHALGSCLGITLHDPVAKVSGMVHVMLPLSKIDPLKARRKPCTFVDTGVSRMFSEAYKLGARKERIALKVAGGAEILDQNGRFRIGQRNYSALRKLLWKNGILIEAEDVGGSLSRTMMLHAGSGKVEVRSSSGESWSL